MSKTTNYKPPTTNHQLVVGLEIHVELSTNTKMFCRCPVPTLQNQPNTRICPICLGLPGALPYPNQQAIESCVKIALSLNCSINKNSFFERKNYFYPDLAKGFQTTQYLHPFGEHGYLDIKIGSETKRVGITRVHMEEDTGKLIHSKVEGKDVSLIDFNRSGVPLVEIVTEPDIRSGEEAKIFLIELQKIIRYLEVSDADMEKGHMRLEPNISLRPVGQTTLANYKVEVKNINSFRFVDKAIQYEAKRHEELLSKGIAPVQETRGWNEFKNKTVSQRSKEEAHDYRYFPEPDIPPIIIDSGQLTRIKDQIPELPEARTKRFMLDFLLTDYNAEILTRDKSLADYFEETVKAGKGHNVGGVAIANYIINKKPDVESLEPAGLVKLIVKQSTKSQMDETKLKNAIQKVLDENPQAIANFKAGKVQIIDFLIGQTIKALPLTTDTEQIRKALQEMLR